jgi:hypothetical protein
MSTMTTTEALARALAHYHPDMEPVYALTDHECSILWGLACRMVRHDLGLAQRDVNLPIPTSSLSRCESGYSVQPPYVRWAYQQAAPGGTVPQRNRDILINIRHRVQHAATERQSKISGRCRFALELADQEVMRW